MRQNCWEIRWIWSQSRLHRCHLSSQTETKKMKSFNDRENTASNFKLGYKLWGDRAKEGRQNGTKKHHRGSIFHMGRGYTASALVEDKLITWNTKLIRHTWIRSTNKSIESRSPSWATLQEREKNDYDGNETEGKNLLLAPACNQTDEWINRNCFFPSKAWDK